MRLLTVVLFIGFIAGCAKPEPPSYYPDCFEGKKSTVKTSGGCGSVFLYAMLDSSHAVTISLRGKELDLKTSCQTFNIRDYPNKIRIQYLTHANHPDSLYFNFCSDAISLPDAVGTIDTYEGVSGKITVAVSKAAQYREWCKSFRASVRLDSLYFKELGSGKRIGPSPRDTLINHLLIVDEEVGICGG